METKTIRVRQWRVASFIMENERDALRNCFLPMALLLRSEEATIVTTNLKEFGLSEELSSRANSGNESIYGVKLFHTIDGLANGERPRSKGMSGYIDVIGNVMCHFLSPCL